MSFKCDFLFPTMKLFWWYSPSIVAWHTAKGNQKHLSDKLRINWLMSLTVDAPLFSPRSLGCNSLVVHFFYELPNGLQKGVFCHSQMKRHLKFPSWCLHSNILILRYFVICICNYENAMSLPFFTFYHNMYFLELTYKLMFIVSCSLLLSLMCTIS